ncbi:sensor histidine kinase [Thiomicrospira sp. ALE5]|uniref:sensor histidine kinase n=1 Tax=Thiomicrospira sp. ALE5 TaxID=748650 RepID=UPI0008EE45CB|nr:ATP-binding protein [Thiomicrospira sp. ALE5]SFR56566.1 His Kinase A (phospho-acceptor) domain-containing protein [Thiomicrospira sp. ALE5]
MNNKPVDTTHLTQTKLGLGFIAISLLVMTASLIYFFQVLQPRLLQEAQDQATLLVNNIASPLADYDLLSDQHQTSLATSLLLLYNDDNQQPFIKAIKLEFNPGLIDKPPLFDGQACTNCFKVSIPIFDKNTAMLLANAKFLVNPINYQRLISDLKNKLLITLLLILFLLLAFWLLLKNLLQQLINAQQHNQSILNSIEDLLLIINSKGIIVDQNPSASKVIPLQSNLNSLIQPLHGQPIDTLIHKNQTSPIEVRFKKGLYYGQIGLMTISRVQSHLYDHQGYYIVLIKNIQALRSAQAELKHQTEMAHLSRLRTLGEMASGIAHEVKQPLAVIRLGAEGLQSLHQQAWSTKNNQFALELDQTIIEQVDRADKIVRNIRSFARLEQAPAEWVKVPDVIESAIGFVKQAYRLDKIKLIEEIDYNVPLLFIEYHKLEQLLVNLIANAKDAIQHKSLTNTFDTSQAWIKIRLFRETDKTTLEVEDNGCGMTPQQQAQCLMPFYTTKSTDEGVGIGLAIVKNVADLYDAELTVESKVGEGTCFRLSFNSPANPTTADVRV